MFERRAMKTVLSSQIYIAEKYRTRLCALALSVFLLVPVAIPVAAEVPQDLQKSGSHKVPPRLNAKVQAYYLAVHAVFAERVRSIADPMKDAELKVAVRIEPDGTISSAQLKNSSGDPDLDRDVLALFNPAVPPWPKGVRVPDALVIPFRFQSLRTNIRTRLLSCWRPPSSGLPIVLTWGLAKDGTITRLETVSAGTDEASRQAVEAAMAAVRTCAPFKLPEQHYDQWRTIQWTFE